uniref:Uncharacterized protein n=1 Tax=Caenorhabditis japonica TaxID=281687 RepID=A0A8R1ECF5_CAEJA
MNRVSLENGKTQDLEKLRKKKDIARENCDKIFSEGTNGVNKNTYGSRKSRANGELKIANGRYKAERLQTSICQTLSKINTLNNIIRKLKRNFGHLQLDELVVDNVGSENYEPS